MNKSVLKEQKGYFFLHVRDGKHLHLNIFMLSLSDLYIKALQLH